MPPQPQLAHLPGGNLRQKGILFVELDQNLLCQQKEPKKTTQCQIETQHANENYRSTTQNTDVNVKKSKFVTVTTSFATPIGQMKQPNA
jgi:tetraacyldisaccharide-1-P 4'-kinase